MKRVLVVWWRVWRDDLTPLGKLTLWPIVLPLVLVTMIGSLLFRDP